MQDQRDEVTWRAGGVPVSERFEDPYFSLENGLEETRHVFLRGNRLPERFRDGFHVAELGFGTGLNCLATVQAWAGAGRPGRLRFTSFEAYPLGCADLERALAAFPALAGPAEQLIRAWARGARDLSFDEGVDLRVIEGDARRTLPAWGGCADAWYLDGFSPARNPELWGDALLAEVAGHTAPGGTAATYTAAGFVRRGLQAAGFAVTRQPGYGRKRHMSVAERIR